ncbi:hypothetical protein BGAL_0172g00200 [Botrytis galanthina]|uniref:Uncharacterized protein n=1 Tax=Botrytis galanthina TaxID=278940 RepID=A0A4S8R0C6_9HELO|nr:hypothetical protein BGAL_0172g00200 [Botrytis galanthina]
MKKVEWKIPRNAGPREYPIFSAPDCVVTLVAVGDDDSAETTADEEMLLPAPVLEAEFMVLVLLEEIEVVDVGIAIAELKVALSTAFPHCSDSHGTDM